MNLLNLNINYIITFDLICITISMLIFYFTFNNKAAITGQKVIYSLCSVCCDIFFLAISHWSVVDNTVKCSSLINTGY